jgi:mannose-6-phosphate isomerase-like protein (cupin superfamily)
MATDTSSNRSTTPADIRNASLTAWSLKPWGRTRPFGDRWELELCEGGYSSLHVHDQHANGFRVESGCVWVVYRDFHKQPHLEQLGPGAEIVIPAGVDHMFLVWESGRAVEWYVPEPGASLFPHEDITRSTQNGFTSIDRFAGVIERAMHGGGHGRR